jgi:uncharacterized protein (TIGR02118 family)
MDADAFEKYFKEQHLPLAQQMHGVSRIEITKFHSSADGGKPEYYRMSNCSLEQTGDGRNNGHLKDNQ